MKSSVTRLFLKNSKLIWVCLVFLFPACRSSQLPASHPIAEPAPSSVKGAWQLTLAADDLTEDVSRVSSGNDEILLLVYTVHDSLAQPEPMIRRLVVLDNAHRTIRDSLPTPVSPLVREWVLVLLEMDSERNLKEIEPIVRVYLKEVFAAYQTKQQSGLNKYLGDEDLLGIQRISVLSPENQSVKKFVFKGVHLFDTYQYTVTLQR
ncbi:MAG: hypothetical protein MUD08_18135 [Cytophagales bacterium]|nr:hypothetical protein [Cytophagales bacterium]